MRKKTLEVRLGHVDRIAGRDCQIELVEDVLIDENEMEVRYEVTPHKHGAVVFINSEPYAVFDKYENEWLFFEYMSPYEAKMRFSKLGIEYKIRVR